MNMDRKFAGIIGITNSAFRICAALLLFVIPVAVVIRGLGDLTPSSGEQA